MGRRTRTGGRGGCWGGQVSPLHPGGRQAQPAYPRISALGGVPPFHLDCVHVLTPSVERLATEEEKAGIISSDLLSRSPAELQRRFRKDFAGRQLPPSKASMARTTTMP